MTQADLNRAVADATGESVGTIANMGFSEADPADANYDPEPNEILDVWESTYIDWDVVETERRVPLVLQPAA
jgi:hypothetical protein